MSRWTPWPTCIPNPPVRPNPRITSSSVSAPSTAAFDTPLNDDERTVNRTFANDLKGWGKLTKNIYVWDYTTDFDFYLYTYPNFSVLQPNIQFLIENNVTGIFEQGNPNKGGEFGELRALSAVQAAVEPEGRCERADGRLPAGVLRQWLEEHQDLYHRV